MGETEVLINVGCSPQIIAHSQKVSETAVKIAGRLTVDCDLELVRQGGLFHDIGRSKTHDISHALAGVAIARELGFSDALVSIIERHIGAGITAREAENLGLPVRDYLPQSVEEKVVSYADNLVSGVREMPFPEALERFRRILGPHHEGIDLFVRQHEEIQDWIAQQ